MLISEVKSLITKMRTLGELARDIGDSTGCLMIDLGAMECKEGCDICELEELLLELLDGFKKNGCLKRSDIRDGPGMNRDKA